MKRPYVKMKISPVEMEFSESLLTGSAIVNAPIMHDSVEVEPYDDEGTFVTSFE